MDFFWQKLKQTQDKLRQAYENLEATLESAKYVVQKRGGLLVVEVRTETKGNLGLGQKIFQGHGYHPVFLDYVSNSSRYHHDFQPPGDSKRIHSELQFDYRVENHRNGDLTLKLSKPSVGRIELDIWQAELSVSACRLYTSWGAKFYDSRHSRKRPRGK